MNICHYCINLLGTLKRLSYFFWKQDCIPRTNSYTVDKNDKPRTIVSFNIQGLFLFMNEAKCKKLLDTIETLDEDVLCLQEVFEDKLKKNIIERVSKKYPYYLLGNQTKKLGVGEDSGLLVLSKYKLKYKQEIILKDSVIPDCFSNKSILYFSVGDIHMSTTHLQSSNILSAEVIAEKQLRLICDKSPFDSFIITGDLNINDAESILNVKQTNEKPTWNEDRLDYILLKGYDDYEIKTSVLPIDIENVSDHYPLKGQIKEKFK